MVLKFSNFLFTPSLLLSVIVLSIIFNSQTIAQSKQAIRFEIDAKRGGMQYTSKDALPRGREFKRLDSTYYVGWLFEGAYKYDHAADYLGYKSATEQIQKAMNLLEKDFKVALNTRTKDLITYINMMKIHRDWDYGMYCLMQAYSNMEEPNQVWTVLQKCKKYDLQDELYMDAYNFLGWTVHRNRFYKSDKYPFLKNTIDENEEYANKLIDSASMKIKRDAILNKAIFNVDYEKEKLPSVWHYKSILYTYQFNIASGSYYYEKLRSTRFFPTNNYATFCAIQAHFREAENYYNLAKNENPGDKRMNESYYYLSIIHNYKGETKKGIEELKQLIRNNGSTPGFGWYNIALTRNLLYDGQIEQAKRIALKAHQFKEIHIGTTLGQSHYDFSISLLQLILKMREIESIKFLNKSWWFSPSDLSRIAQLTVEKYGLQFLMINQFAANPERDRVIYKLFSTESTVSFDEISLLLQDFSTNFFLQKFKKTILTEKRNDVKRYYEFMIAHFLIKKGNYSEALSYLEGILQQNNIDKDYEKLLIARIYESIIRCHLALGQTKLLNQEKVKYYTTFPQLVPYSGIQIPMRLHQNAIKASQVKIIDKLKTTNIEWVTDIEMPAVDVYIQFTTNHSIPIIQFQTKVNGIEIVPLTEISYKNWEEAAKELSFYIFDIGNDDKNISSSDKPADHVKTK